MDKILKLIELIVTRGVSLLQDFDASPFYLPFLPNLYHSHGISLGDTPLLWEAFRRQ